VWGSIFDQRKSQLHHCTIGFQKPGICAVQIPGFWNPMQCRFLVSGIQWYNDAIGIFSDQNRRLVDSDLLRRFAGTAMSYLPAVPLAHFHLREVFNSPENLQELWPDQSSTVLYTDASGTTDWGSVLEPPHEIECRLVVVTRSVGDDSSKGAQGCSSRSASESRRHT
jgi:hypothetical protein